MMTQAQRRSLALGAARSYLRQMRITPEMVTASDAHAALDDVARVEPDTVAACWYRLASHTQMVLFYREWEHWRTQRRSLAR